MPPKMTAESVPLLEAPLSFNNGAFLDAYYFSGTRIIHKNIEVWKFISFLDIVCIENLIT